MSATIKTTLYLAVLTVLLVTAGYLIGGKNGAIIFFVFSLIMNFVSYWWSESIALKMAHAKPLPESGNASVYNQVRVLSGSMGIPAPKIYYTDDMQANAFATGRNPSHSSICLTAGIMNLLDKDELNGVIAHELSHIKNRDVLITTVSAVIAGAVSALANMAMFFGRGRDSHNAVGALMMIILGPLAAALVQMAISREREFLADETGGKISRKPDDLANALLKIDHSIRRVPMRVNPALSSLYIENPLGMGSLANLFSTHPPIRERVERLKRMAR